jgi:AcrR family transcriptional regulator
VRARAAQTSRTDAVGERRIEILKSAAAAFRRRGYHGASVDEIASALSMTKGNLYYYFRNKEEILFACHEYSLDVLLGLLQDVQAELIAPDEKLRALILAFIHIMLDELRGTALTLDLDALSPILLRRVIARRDRFDEGLRQIIQQGIEDGVFRAGDPKMIGFAIMGAVNWIAKWFDPAGPLTSDEIGRQFVDYLVGGLRLNDERRTKDEGRRKNKERNSGRETFNRT